MTMNIYMTTGTYDFLHNIELEHSEEKMVIMQNAEGSLLLHETNGESFFKSPRKYEVIDSAGDFARPAFVVMNNVPVTQEGRPLFEYRISSRARMIEAEPGFLAIRVLRPLSTDTYVTLTVWENDEAFLKWQNSKAYEKAHEKRGTEQGIDTQPNIFSSAPYVTKYTIPEE